MHDSLWKTCLSRLEHELSEQQLNTWIRPLQALEDSNRVRLLAPNRFVLDWVREHHLARIREIMDQVQGAGGLQLDLDIGSGSVNPAPAKSKSAKGAARGKTSKKVATIVAGNFTATAWSANTRSSPSSRENPIS